MDIKGLVESVLFENKDDLAVDVIDKDTIIDVMCPYMTTAILTTNLLNSFLPAIATDYVVVPYNGQTYYRVSVNGYMMDPKMIAKILYDNGSINSNIIKE